MSGRSRSAVTLLVVVLATLLAGTSPAAAEPPWYRGGTGAPTPTTGVQRTKVKTCRLYAGEVGFGMSCGTVTGGGVTIRQILGTDPLPGCWHEALPGDLAAEYAPLEQEAHDKGIEGRYVLKTCLEGIDPRTLRVVGEVAFTEEVVWFSPGDTYVELTERQKRLVERERKDRTIPRPVVITSPSVRPRVGQAIAFTVTNGATIGPEAYNRAGVAVLMRARLTHLQVTPEPGAAVVDCNGVEAVRPIGATDTPESRPDACWHRFTRSSAAQPNQTYAMDAVASWAIEYSADAGRTWRGLAVVEKEQTKLQEVTEVQTVVVP